jgi:glycosyltransferase involved in cell wall biosynthesis
VRILICASSAPLPPVDGFRLLLEAVVAHLRRDHDVRVLAFLRSDQAVPDPCPPDLELVPMPGGGTVRSAGRLVTTSLRRRPLNADRLAHVMAPHLLRTRDRWRPDVVLVTSGRLAALGRFLGDTPRVLGAVDARHLNVHARADRAGRVRGRALRAEARHIERAMSRDYAEFHRVIVVTEEDRRATLAAAPALDVVAVANGVDTERFRPEPHATTADRLVLTGTMSYAPNVTAAEELARQVLPAVRRTHPGLELALVGRSPGPEVLALDALDGVHVTGEVPDIRPWLVGSRVFVAPLRTGSGIKNKILEAMACGRPCVVTPRGLQGLTCQPGRDLIVADTVAALAEGVRDLLDDPARAAAMGAAARRYVVDHHGWGSVAARYADVLSEAAHRSAPDGAHA